MLVSSSQFGVLHPLNIKLFDFFLGLFVLFLRECIELLVSNLLLFDVVIQISFLFPLSFLEFPLLLVELFLQGDALPYLLILGQLFLLVVFKQLVLLVGIPLVCF